jgi:predicted alpha/beta-fold hydrolase
VREEFTLKDGGLMALDWTIEHDGSALPIADDDGNLTKPILIIVPGLSGANDNWYTMSVMLRARKLGYKCCTVITRGCAGLPVKTPLLSHPSLYKDMDECINYVYKKYIRDSKNKRNR